MAPIECSECHRVPALVVAQGHLDRGQPTPADVVFSGRAVARGRDPIYSGGGCVDVACHGAGLPDGAPLDAPWDAPTTPSPEPCARCHGAPPDSPHTSLDSCATTLCHGGQVAPTPDGPSLTAAGQAMHIDGAVR
jgi:hypothetical protein